MPEARMHITVPEDVWVGQLTRSYPGATFKILAAMADGNSGGISLAEIHSDRIDKIVADMRAFSDVSAVTVMESTSDRALVQFETSTPMLLLAARDSGIPLEMPFELSNGTVTWEVIAPSDRLSELGTQLRAFGLSFTIDYIQQEINRDDLLTDSQDDIVETAITEGYYDTPRTCSLTELAEKVDRAKSTVSETLHRAESKIIKEYADVERNDETEEKTRVTLAQ